jgi:hypothetical protein
MKHADTGTGERMMQFLTAFGLNIGDAVKANPISRSPGIAVKAA